MTSARKNGPLRGVSLHSGLLESEPTMVYEGGVLASTRMNSSPQTSIPWSPVRALCAMWAIAMGSLLAGCGIQEIPQASNAVDAAWGEVQNQYERRADLVPNLVATVKGYATHEQETLQAVTEARAKATSVNVSPADLDPAKMKQFEEAQGALSSSLGRLLAVSERYPDLKANENFKDLQTQLEGTENRIAIARRRYIEAVQAFNNVITVPPTSFTNSLFYHKPPKPQFSATTPGAEKAPEVKF